MKEGSEKKERFCAKQGKYGQTIGWSVGAARGDRLRLNYGERLLCTPYIHAPLTRVSSGPIVLRYTPTVSFAQ